MDIEPEAEATARELHGILHHERAREILANDWVMDSTLPIPSIRAILLLASLLAAPRVLIKIREGRSEVAVDFLEYAGTRPLEEVIPAVIRHLREVPPANFREAIQRENHFLESRKLRHEGGRVYEWTVALALFHGLSGSGEVARDVGARRLASRFLETLVLRAVLHQDQEALRALAEGMAMVPASPPVANRIASEIRGWQPRLSRELGRELTKGAMKAFLIELFPYFASALPATWAEAWKLAGWSTENDRKGPRRNDDATTLARRIQAEK